VCCQVNVHTAVYVVPFWMMIHRFCQQCHLRHETKSRNKIREDEITVKLVFVGEWGACRGPLWDQEALDNTLVFDASNYPGSTIAPATDLDVYGGRTMSQYQRMRWGRWPPSGPGWGCRIFSFLLLQSYES